MSFKRYISFGDLPIGDYIVHRFDLVKTKFGEKVRCDIGDKILFLPKRCIEELAGGKDIDSKLIHLNAHKYWLLYRGKDVSKENKLMVEIVSNDVYIDQSISQFLHISDD